MSETHKSDSNAYTGSDLPDTDEIQLKAQLVTKIREIIKSNGWTQQEAAEILQMSQPKLSNMLHGKFHGISQAKMLRYLTRLGRDVQIVIGSTQQSTKTKVKITFID